MLQNRLPTRETQVRFARFLVVGGLAAVVQIVAVWIAKRIFTADLAFSVSFVCSTATHYTLNRCWALPSDRRDSARQLVEYLATAALSYAMNLGLFKLGHRVGGLPVEWAAALAIPPSTLFVFLVLNFRVFRRTRSKL